MSTYAIYGEIEFPAANGRGALKIRRFSSVKIESSWKSLTDTAEIVLPRKVKDFDRENIAEVFHEGDPVIIRYGYNGELNQEKKLPEEFSGYISKISVGIPIVIRCEDEMYKLKRKKATVTADKEFSLEDILKSVAPGYPIKCDNAKLIGTLNRYNEPVGVILDDLRNMGVNVWFEGEYGKKELHAFAISRSDIDPVPIVLEKTAGESLKQKVVDDVYVILKCLILQNKKAQKYITAKCGEEAAGKQIKKTISGITITQDALQKEAEAIYKQAKTPGLDGDITLFGIPRVKHGMKIKLSSILYPEKDGTYYVDAVTKTLEPEGIRQKCKLGDKAA